MHIYAVGLNHRAAPIELRERLAFDEDAVRAALRAACDGAGQGMFTEMAILSTCNRIEIYVASEQIAIDALIGFLAQWHLLQTEEICPYLSTYVDHGAVYHLFEVAAGLDSLVLGEPQILGQVTRALDMARNAGTVKGTLTRLFQSAIHAGKRARAETHISRNPTSVASLAASLCERQVGSLEAVQVVVLGAGEIAELAIEALRKRGVRSIQVVNRTFERAFTLAQRWQAEVVPFECLETAMANADILITSSGASYPIIPVEMVAAAMQQRPTRPLALIDIAVPRDVAPEAAGLPQVSLFDMDDLNAHLDRSLAERRCEVPRVREILDEEAGPFLEFLQSAPALAVVAALRQQAELIRQAELRKTLCHLPGLNDAERAQIDVMTQSLVNKLLETPTRRLRSEATWQHTSEYASVARTLFGLSAEEDDCQAAVEVLR